jgi:tRNA(adenine34) deaminase
MNHIVFMNRCIELALMAKKRGDHPVGSVVVQGERVIGEGIEGGRTFNDISRHAEMEAIREATQLLKSQDLSGTVLYTTHEPCIMCSYMIRHTRIEMVVTGIKVPETGGFSSAYPLLLDKTIKKWGDPPGLVFGVLEKECRELTAV